MESRFDELLPAAVNMLQHNMGVAKGEKILFLTDVPVPLDWELPFGNVADLTERALMTKRISEKIGSEFPSCQVDFHAFPQTGQSGMEPPPEVGKMMLDYDLVIIMATHSLSHTNARQKASDSGVRIASMPNIEGSMFAADGPMNADYDAIDRDCKLWADRLTAGSEVHITTPFGTDLKFSIKGRKGHSDNGIYQGKGDWGNLPAGESYTAPVEGTAEGKMVVPKGWYPQLTEDMTLIFEKGDVVSVYGGGEVGAGFIKTFDFANPVVKHRRNCAELGIGTNPKASKMDNPLEAEKIKGTIHVAVGDSSHVGGISESDLHKDFILCKPSLFIDGKQYI
jgi:leucyl aminopeptidase (aminopeptidase T)